MTEKRAVRAPRGKQFAVWYWSHVTPRNAKLRELPQRFDLLDEAEQATTTIDWRLQPVVVILNTKEKLT